MSRMICAHFLQESRRFQQIRQDHQNYKTKQSLKELHEERLGYSEFFEERERSTNEFKPAVKRARGALRVAVEKRPAMQEKMKSYQAKKAKLTQEMARCTAEHEAAKRFMISPR